MHGRAGVADVDADAERPTIGVDARFANYASTSARAACEEERRKTERKPP